MMRASSRIERKLTRFNRKNVILWTAAAAFSTTLSASPTQAFAIQPSRRPTTRTTYEFNPLLLAPFTGRTLQTRLYSTRKDNEGGFLATLKKGAKKLLPASWFQSEEDKTTAIERKRVQNEFQGSIKELLKDAPLPVKMVGRMIAPLLTNVMSGLAETMAEQQKEIDEVLSDAKSYLLADPAVAKLVGDGPIQVGTPFSQSSSSSSINGVSTTRVELAFPVQGSTQSGVAKATSANGSLQKLVLQAGDRTISVSLSSKTPRPSAFRKASRGSDDIIEAEIIEKNTKV
jgi:hypothetical protein